MTPALTRVSWDKTYRLISTRQPYIGVFDLIAPDDERALLYELEGLTNDRLIDMGRHDLVPEDEWVVGTGASIVMAPFTHPGESRFSSGAYGLYYGAQALETAVREVSYHRARFLRRTSEPATVTHERAHIGKLDAHLHDVRDPQFEMLHHPDDWCHGQRVGAALKAAGSDGVVYRSVRHFGGECFGAFRPRIVPPPIWGSLIHLFFNGTRVDGWLDVNANVTHSL